MNRKARMHTNRTTAMERSFRTASLALVGAVLADVQPLFSHHFNAVSGGPAFQHSPRSSRANG